MKIGLYGGSFDPVHIGHEWIVRRAFETDLNKICVMPCRISPHKLDRTPCATSLDRLEMLKLAFQDNPEVLISDWELERNSISYTWETIDYLKKTHIDPELTLIMGGDQFQVIHTWTRYDYWSHDVEYLIFPRVGEENDFKRQKNAGLKFRVLEDLAPQVSSSMIRKEISQSLAWGTKVSPKVRDYIIQKSLYLA